MAQNRTRSIPLAVLATTAAALTACGSGDEFVSQHTEDTGVPLSEVPALYAEAACNALEDCAGPLLELLLNGEDCETVTRRALEDELPGLEQGVEDGIIEYDGTKVTSCLEDLEALGCQVVTTRHIDSCEEALRGTLPEGDDCESSAACEPGTYCQTESSCPGQCVELERAGGDCSVDDQCQDGLVCGDSGSCERPAEDGDDCQAGNADCAPGLVCIGADEDAGTAGKCQPVEDAFTGQVGDECGLLGLSLCDPDLACAFSLTTSITNLLATECKEPVDEDEACQLAIPDECPSDQYCQPESPGGTLSLAGVCTDRPSEGQACGTPFFSTTPSICSAYSRCVDGTCVQLERAGGSCDDDIACYTHNCVGGKCEPQGICD